MGAYSGVGAYLSSSGSEVGAYSGGGFIREWGHNQSFTVSFNLFVLPFLLTPCLVVAFQPCMQ